MRTKALTTMALLATTLSASAEVELLFHFSNGNFSHYSVIERSKQIYWMDDDENTAFTFKDYKKSGNSETFTLVPKEQGMGLEPVHVTTTLDADRYTATIQYKEPILYGGKKFEIKTTSPAGIVEQNRLLRYFNQKAGNPTEQGVIVVAGSEPTPPTVDTKPEMTQPATQNATDKVKGAAKDAVGKVKSIFKKK